MGRKERARTGTSRCPRRKALRLTKVQQLKGLTTTLKQIHIRHVEIEPQLEGPTIGWNVRSLFRPAWTSTLVQGMGSGLLAYQRYTVRGDGETYDREGAAKRTKERVKQMPKPVLKKEPTAKDLLIAYAILGQLGEASGIREEPR